MFNVFEILFVIRFRLFPWEAGRLVRIGNAKSREYMYSWLLKFRTLSVSPFSAGKPVGSEHSVRERIRFGASPSLSEKRAWFGCSSPISFFVLDSNSCACSYSFSFRARVRVRSRARSNSCACSYSYSFSISCSYACSLELVIVFEPVLVSVSDRVLVATREREKAWYYGFVYVIYVFVIAYKKGTRSSTLIDIEDKVIVKGTGAKAKTYYWKTSRSSNHEIG